MRDSTILIKDRIRTIKLVTLDVDGVLTDGGVYIFENGEEFRRFDIKDGAGLKALQAAGIIVTVISSSICSSIYRRCDTLGIREVHTKVEDKLLLLLSLCAKYDVSPEEVCYMGDDLVDIPVMTAVGFACAPMDAHHMVHENAHYVTEKPGGYGAVRELCDMILVGRA